MDRSTRRTFYLFFKWGRNPRTLKVWWLIMLNHVYFSEDLFYNELQTYWSLRMRISVVLGWIRKRNNCFHIKFFRVSCRIFLIKKKLWPCSMLTFFSQNSIQCVQNYPLFGVVFIVKTHFRRISRKSFYIEKSSQCAYLIKVIFINFQSNILHYFLFRQCWKI